MLGSAVMQDNTFHANNILVFGLVVIYLSSVFRNLHLYF